MSTEANLRICDLQLEIAALQRQLFESFDEIYKLKTSRNQNKAFRDLLDELKEENRDLQDELRAVKAERENMSPYRTLAYQEDVDQAEQRIEDLERELEDMHLELRESTVHYREQLLELRSENMIMAERIDTLTKGDQ